MDKKQFKAFLDALPQRCKTLDELIQSLESYEDWKDLRKVIDMYDLPEFGGEEPCIPDEEDSAKFINQVGYDPADITLLSWDDEEILFLYGRDELIKISREDVEEGTFDVECPFCGRGLEPNDNCKHVIAYSFGDSYWVNNEVAEMVSEITDADDFDVDEYGDDNSDEDEYEWMFDDFDVVVMKKLFPGLRFVGDGASMPHSHGSFSWAYAVVPDDVLKMLKKRARHKKTD